MGHVYQLLGHVNGYDVVVETFSHRDQRRRSRPIPAFSTPGTEFYLGLRLRPGDSMPFDSGALHGPELLVKRLMTYLSLIIYPRHLA